MQTNFRNAKLRVWSNTEGLKSVPITPAEKEEPATLKLREIPALFQNIHEVIDEGEQEKKQIKKISLKPMSRVVGIPKEEK